MSYGHPQRPEGLEENAEQIGAIYWVPGKGDIVVGWHPDFLRDIHEQGLTKSLIGWAERLGKKMAEEFKERSQ